MKKLVVGILAVAVIIGAGFGVSEMQQKNEAAPRIGGL